MKKFPKVLHVVVEKPTNDAPYLVALNNGVENLTESQPVAVYRLVEVKALTITHALK